MSVMFLAGLAFLAIRLSKVLQYSYSGLVLEVHRYRSVHLAVAGWVGHCLHEGRVVPRDIPSPVSGNDATIGLVSELGKLRVPIVLAPCSISAFVPLRYHVRRLVHALVPVLAFSFKFVASYAVVFR